MKFTSAERILSKLVVEDTIKDSATENDLENVIQIIQETLDYMKSKFGSVVIQNILVAYTASLQGADKSNVEPTLDPEFAKRIGSEAINLNANNLLKAVILELEAFLSLTEEEQLRMLENLNI